MKSITRKLNAAHTAQKLLQGRCDELAKIFQPYIPFDVAVFYQPSDGFVLFWDDKSRHGHVNVSVEQAKKNIDSDSQYYMNGWKP